MAMENPDQCPAADLRSPSRQAFTRDHYFRPNEYSGVRIADNFTRGSLDQGVGFWRLSMGTHILWPEKKQIVKLQKLSDSCTGTLR